jgi:hypothetical protein
MRQVWGRFAYFAVCATVVITAGCSGPPETAKSPRISPLDAGFGAAIIPNRTDGKPYPVVNAIGLCIDMPGSVEVLDVSLEHSEGGLKLDAFTLTPKTDEGLPNPITFTETLQDLGFQPGTNVVRTHCPSLTTAAPDNQAASQSNASEEGQGITDLELQFSKPGEKTARGGIILVKYKSGNEILIHRVGFGLVLCAGDAEIPECEAKSYGWK